MEKQKMPTGRLVMRILFALIIIANIVMIAINFSRTGELDFGYLIWVLVAAGIYFGLLNRVLGTEPKDRPQPKPAKKSEEKQDGK